MLLITLSLLCPGECIRFEDLLPAIGSYWEPYLLKAKFIDLLLVLAGIYLIYLGTR